MRVSTGTRRVPAEARRSGATRAGRTIVAVVSVGALAACSTLPHDTKPQILQSYAPGSAKEPAVGPQPGQEPDLLLRDFYTASALPSGDYAAARQYLTPDIADSWTPEGSVLLVDAIDIITATDSVDGDERAYSVRGTVIGTLESGGAYLPENGAYEAEIRMKQVDGQWRIADLPAGVVIERTELRNQYQPDNLYFFTALGSSLVADRRWVYTGQKSLDSELITMLMQGPSSQLQPAVRTVVPAGAVFAGAEDGVYRFTGMSTMSEEERTQFAAELVWTLSNAGVVAPYKATADGAPLVPGLDEMTTDDFAEYNPRDVADAVPEFYAVNGGNIVHVTGDEVEPLSGELGTGGRVQSAEVTSSGQVAAVCSTGNQSQLVMGSVDGELSNSVSADTLSRPSFERSTHAAWVVVDGDRIVRLVPASDSNRVIETEVNSSALDGIKGEISVLRLSPTGVRVAMIIGGKIFTGIVVRETNGDTRIANVREMASELGGTALTLDWQPDGSLVVGTSTPETPVWRVEQDGSSVSTLPAGNITAPVVSIAASQSTVYATDANAVLQLNPQESNSTYWREVPGLQGQRSAPIVAN
mgnify:CR=1 FL=1